MAVARSVTARLCTSVADYVHNEDGAATIWNLTWLIGFAIMLGLALDSTNARRHETMLQSTADVAALAGVIELPNPELQIPYSTGGYTGVEDKAIEFADKNMDRAEHGDYMQSDDVYIGHWDDDTRQFIWGENFSTPDQYSVNAVKVFLGRNDINHNNVPTTYLKFVGLDRWNINTTATAMTDVPDCLKQGFMAQAKVCIASNNDFYLESCIYGEKGLNFRNGNEFHVDTTAIYGPNASNNVDPSNEEAGLTVSGPEKLPVPIVDEIYDVAYGLLTGDKLNYAKATGGVQTVDGVPSVYQITDPNILGNNQLQTGWWLHARSNVQLAYAGDLSSLAGLLTASASGQTGPAPYGCQTGQSTGTNLSQQEIADGKALKPDPVTYAGTADSTNLAKNRVYYYPGSGGGAGNDTLTISGWLSDVVVVSEARINIAADAILDGVTLVSLYSGGGHQGITVGQGVAVGYPDDCADGRGSLLAAVGSINGASGVTWNGSVVAAGGNLGFAAQSDGIYGIAAYAKGNVFFPSNGKFGDLDNCSGNVDTTFEPDDYIFMLVE